MITKEGMLMQERQRSVEAHSLKETVRRLRFENKEVCLCDRNGYAHAVEAVVHGGAFLNIYILKIQRYVLVITKKGMLMQERQRSVDTLPQGDCPTSVIQK